MRFKASILRCVYFKKSKNLGIYNSHLAQDKTYLQCMVNKNRVSLKKIVEEREQIENSSNGDIWSKEKLSTSPIRIHSTNSNEQVEGNIVKLIQKPHDIHNIV